MVLSTFCYHLYGISVSVRRPEMLHGQPERKTISWYNFSQRDFSIDYIFLLGRIFLGELLMLMWSVHRVSGNVLRLASTYPTCLLSSRVPLSIGWPVQGSVLVICEDGLVMSPRHIVMAACWGAHVFLRKVGLHCSSCHYAMQDDHLSYQFHKEIVIQLIVRIKIGIQHLIQYDAGKWVSPFFLSVAWYYHPMVQKFAWSILSSAELALKGCQSSYTF